MIRCPSALAHQCGQVRSQRPSHQLRQRQVQEPRRRAQLLLVFRRKLKSNGGVCFHGRKLLCRATACLEILRSIIIAS